MKPTSATKDDQQRFVAVPPNTPMSVIGKMRELAANWNDKSRIEQVTARHRMHDISGIPNSEYTASWSDVALLINERKRLQAAMQKFVDAYGNGKEARLGNGQARRSLDEFKQLLNDATTSTSAGGG